MFRLIIGAVLSLFATICFGDENPLVVDIQRALSGYGYYSGAIDGITGQNTRGAVQSFREDFEIGDDFPLVSEATARQLGIQDYSGTARALILVVPASSSEISERFKSLDEIGVLNYLAELIDISLDQVERTVNEDFSVVSIVFGPIEIGTNVEVKELYVGERDSYRSGEFSFRISDRILQDPLIMVTGHRSFRPHNLQHTLIIGDDTVAFKRTRITN